MCACAVVDYLCCQSRICSVCSLLFFFQAEDGIRDLVRSRGLGDVYKRQVYVGLDALSDYEVAAAVGNSMFADLTSVAGSLYTVSYTHLTLPASALV